MLWLSRFYPNLHEVVPQGSTGQHAGLINLAWIGIALASGVVLVRWQRTWAIPVVIAGIGLAGMTLQVVLLFAFQVFHGYVYAEVSLIITAFMAGLALGATSGNHLLATWLASPEKRARQTLMGVQLAIALFSGVFLLMIRLSLPAPTLVFPLLALLAGMLGGMAFPLALALIKEGRNASHTAGMLYGADLVGGCLGALFSAVLLVPLLGIPQTCAIVALVALAGLVALA